MHGTVYIDYKLTEIKLLITDMHVHLNYMYVSINCLTLLQESDSVQQTTDTYYEDMTVTSEIIWWRITHPTLCLSFNK